MLLGGKSCGKSTVLKNVAGVTNEDKKGGTSEIKMEKTGQVGRVLCVARARSPPTHIRVRYSTDAISPLHLAP